MPTAVPMIPDSARGVFMTRSSPNLSRSPSVARKTPPRRPMSSPRTQTRSSRAISSERALLTAWSRVIWGIGCLSPSRERRLQGERGAARVLADLAAFHRDEELALLAQVGRHLGVDVGEQRLERRLRHGLVALEGGGDLL